MLKPWNSVKEQYNIMAENNRQRYMQAPVDGWYSRSPYNWGGYTVPSSDWRGVYICFISVID